MLKCMTLSVRTIQSDIAQDDSFSVKQKIQTGEKDGVLFATLAVSSGDSMDKTKYGQNGRVPGRPRQFRPSLGNYTGFDASTHSVTAKPMGAGRNLGWSSCEFGKLALHEPSRQYHLLFCR